MRSFTIKGFAIFALFAVSLSGVWCNGEEEIVAAPMGKKEQEALYSAIQGFVGKWWNGSELYPDPCGWTPIQGVSCDLFDGLWYVTALNIGPVHDNSLACALHPEFRSHLFALQHLKSLSFFNCFVSPRRHPLTIPTHNWEAISGSLESLEFRSNPGLIGQIPTTFGNLRKLKSLVLLENGLVGKVPSNIAYTIELQRLVLSGNKLSGSIPYSFGGLKKLLICDLSRNSLSGTLPSTFGGLTSILKLDLSNNQLEGKIPREIGFLKNLTLLDLSCNKFSGGLSKSIQELFSVEELVLSNNPIGGDIMNFEWHNLQNLVILDLSNMGLKGGIPESIAELMRLRFLGLNDNKFIGEISPKLAALPCVTSLYLNGNNLTGNLDFSQLFYEKMGRKFRAWDNPNLCYPNGLIAKNHVPNGVKPCRQEVKLYEIDFDTKSQMGKGNLKQNNDFIASLGVSSCCIDGFWLIFVLEICVVVLVGLSGV